MESHLEGVLILLDFDKAFDKVILPIKLKAVGLDHFPQTEYNESLLVKTLRNGQTY